MWCFGSLYGSTDSTKLCSCDATISIEEPFCFDLDTYQKYLTHNNSPLLVLEIKHTFIRILATYCTLVLDGYMGA